MIQEMMDINTRINHFIWGIPAIICIMGVGFYLTYITGFIQFKKLGYTMKETIGKAFQKKEAMEGTLSPFQAVCTALAATVGTGNITGVAGAIAIGGAGAVFWMWISALFGMCTKMAEVTLAVIYREENANGEIVGGPMYYIQNGLGKKFRWLAVIYAGFGILATFGIGVTTQVSTIVTAIDTVLINYQFLPSNKLEMANFIIGIILGSLVMAVLVGGMKRIGNVAELLVPFMAGLYIILSLGVLILHIQRLPGVLQSIVYGAFYPKAVTGGIVGSFFISMRRGVSRGIFSNEAGLGTASIAHASADTPHPVKQGLFGIFEVFVDTILICTLTAFVILCSGVTIPFGEEVGADLTIAGFTSVYGNWVSIFTAIAIVCFAFSTIIAWGLYGARFIAFLFPNKVEKIFFIVYSCMALAGATLDLKFIWEISDTFNGLMSIPNLIALFLLAKVFAKEVREYFSKRNLKEIEDLYL